MHLFLFCRVYEFSDWSKSLLFHTTPVLSLSLSLYSPLSHSLLLICNRRVKNLGFGITRKSNLLEVCWLSPVFFFPLLLVWVLSLSSARCSNEFQFVFVYGGFWVFSWLACWLSLSSSFFSFLVVFFQTNWIFLGGVFFFPSCIYFFV